MNATELTEERVKALECFALGQKMQALTAGDEHSARLWNDYMLVSEAWLASRTTDQPLLTEEQRDALERAAKANEGMARVCHAAGKAYETRCHLEDAATLRALASRTPPARQEIDAARRSPQTAHEDMKKGAGAWLSDGERRLRKMLAFAYSGSRLYGDDGELQDASTRPFIDYMRDSIQEIEAAIYARGMAALSPAEARGEKCETCGTTGGGGLVGSAEDRSDGEPCPDCTAPKQDAPTRG